MNVGSKASVKKEIITQLDNLGCKIDEKGVNCNVFSKKSKAKITKQIISREETRFRALLKIIATNPLPLW